MNVVDLPDGHHPGAQHADENEGRRGGALSNGDEDTSPQETEEGVLRPPRDVLSQTPPAEKLQVLREKVQSDEEEAESGEKRSEDEQHLEVLNRLRLRGEGAEDRGEAELEHRPRVLDSQ